MKYLEITFYLMTLAYIVVIIAPFLNFHPLAYFMMACCIAGVYKSAEKD